MLVQKYKKKRGDRLVYDYIRACENEPLIRESKLLDRYGRIGLAKMVYKVNRAIHEEEKYLRITNPKNHPMGYRAKKEIFGNVEGEIGYESLWDEIRGLIEKGENPKDHSRRLQRKYNQKKKIIEDLWDWISLEEKRIEERLSKIQP